MVVNIDIFFASEAFFFPISIVTSMIIVLMFLIIIGKSEKIDIKT